MEAIMRMALTGRHERMSPAARAVRSSAIVERGRSEPAESASRADGRTSARRRADRRVQAGAPSG